MLIGCKCAGENVPVEKQCRNWINIDGQDLVVMKPNGLEAGLTRELAGELEKLGKKVSPAYIINRVETRITLTEQTARQLVEMIKAKFGV